MNLVFVTCIYDNLFMTDLGGRTNPTQKYFFGLESAMKVNTQFIIYCWESYIPNIVAHFSNFLGIEEFQKRVMVLPFDLYSTEFRTSIQNYKNSEFGKNLPGDRSYDVMISKFLMLKHSIENDLFKGDYYFWIDAGLSSSSLFPNKHLDTENYNRKYSSCKLFTPKIVDSLINLSSEKVLLFKNNSFGYQFDGGDLPHGEGNYFIIGGIFGGEKNKILEFCVKSLNKFKSNLFDKNKLYTEEQIMTILYSWNKNDYEVINFDCWHHEDSGDWVQGMIVGKYNFYKIFEKLNN